MADAVKDTAKDVFLSVRVAEEFKAATLVLAKYRFEQARDTESAFAKPEIGEYIRWLIQEDMARAEQEIAARRKV